VTDGRAALGTVVRSISTGLFIAINADGKIVGQYASLREASRALPGGAS
jgi:hypothetical protein